MADFLNKCTKATLLLLADDLDTEVSKSDKVKVIITKIKEASDFDANYAKDRLKVIIDELEREKENGRLEREKEIERLEKEKEIERLEKEKEIERLEKEKEIERLERESVRQFELEKLRIQQSSETTSLNSTVSVPETIKRVNLRDLVPKFNPREIDITLFFMIFERQAERANVTEDDLVSQLIPLLPVEISELIVKEPADKSNDYQHIKKVLLKRFRLGTGALKARFNEHQRKLGALWSDLVYELRGYLDNWLESIDVKDFDALKELMITEQIKRRVPLEIKDKYLDEWDEIKIASVLADKCDRFESVRGRFRRSENRYGEKKTYRENNEKGQINIKNKNDAKVKFDTSEKKDSAKNNWRKERAYEKKREILCFSCNQPGHIRPECPDLKKNNKPRNDSINHVKSEVELGGCFRPYVKKAMINDVERHYLIDSGASVDLINNSWVDSKDFTGEITWVRQPLDDACRCLPLAWVTITGDFGTIKTKAAVKPMGLDTGYYLLGNKTAELIEENIRNPNLINAVMTRSKAREKTVENSFRRDSRARLRGLSEEEGREKANAEANVDGSEPPLVLVDKSLVEKTGLEQVSSEVFCVEQKECASLQKFWERAENPSDEEFRVKEGKLLRVARANNGDVRFQLCVPLIFRKQLMSLCHEEIAGHLGTTKTKDRVLRHYYWPNCYKEIENFVKTCDPCQKVGKNKDKKKAPLKIVPIISETFSRLNIDCVGPLTLSAKNNRYLLTSICLASKYPDAIPIENVTSTSIIEALIQVFSRTGYPKEIQCDLGSSFTSVLTSEFFGRFGIRVIHSSVCHPESNSVERLHSTLKRVLKALCLETGKDWEKVLPMALFALRTVTHESTGFSPAELIHGKNLRLPHALLYENWINKENIDQNVVDYILNLINRLKRCQDLATEKMADGQKKRKLWYDRNAVTRKFKVGDQVLVLATSKPNKMALNWIGPGTVTGVISETNYTIDLPEKNNKGTIYHINLMKAYHRRPDFINLLVDEDLNEVEDNAEIPYPVADPNYLDFWEMVKNSDLEKRLLRNQIERFREMVERHRKVFSPDPGRTNRIEMDIVLTDDQPVRIKPYRMSPRQTGILREEIRRLLDLGVIELGQSDYASPMILVESPGKDPRPCVDYRRLNAKTRTEFFPLPNIEEVVERVSAAKFITIVDLSKGYFQIPLTASAQRYAAFVTPFGSFIPKVMFFGLQNAGFQFCRLIAGVLEGLENCAISYIDDIAIFSATWEQHLKDIEAVLKRLGDANLTIKPSKCRFAQNHVKFLGHEVGSGKRSPSEAKLDAIKSFPVPTSKTQLRAFLGTVGYYSRYIKNYASIAVPLTNALKGKVKKEKILWDTECNRAFEELKTKLMQSPVLYAPDFTKKFIVQTDASMYGAGIVLSQLHGKDEHPILYLSKKFTRAEQNYSTIERELAAIVYGLKKLRHYLDGQQFIIQTDHNPLIFLKKMVGENSRLTRWALCLQQYQFEIEHRPGKFHGNADGLSRKE